MKNPASVNAENCSNQRKCLRGKGNLVKTCLVVFGIVLVSSYLFLNQLASFTLSSFLGREVKVGRVGLSDGLRFLDVRIYEDGGIINVEEVLLDLKLLPISRIGIERISLTRPVLLPGKGKSGFPEIKSPNELPTVIVTGGKLILGDGVFLYINHLKLDGFVSPVISDIVIFTDLELYYKGLSSAFRGRISMSGKQDMMRADMDSCDFEIEGLEVEDFHACMTLNGAEFSVTEICCSMFDGLLKGSVRMNLASKEYVFGGEFRKLNIEEIGESLGVKGEKDVSGLLDVDLNFKGRGKNLRSLYGKGAIRVRDGQLWEVPVLYGLRNLMLKSAFKGAVFKEGGCAFEIVEGVLKTDDLKLMSEDVGLAAEGTLNTVDGKLDLVVTSVFTEGFMAKTPELVKITSLLSKLLDFFIVRYRVGGTIADPSYQLIPLPVITTIPLQIEKIIRVLFPGKSRNSL